MKGEKITEIFCFTNTNKKIETCGNFLNRKEEKIVSRNKERDKERNGGNA